MPRAAGFRARVTILSPFRINTRSFARTNAVAVDDKPNLTIYENQYFKDWPGDVGDASTADVLMRACLENTEERIRKYQ